LPKGWDDAMTAEERAVAVLKTFYFGERLTFSSTMVDAVAGAIREAVLAEREAIARVVADHLAHDDQRAVSWHEVRDCLAAVRARPAPWAEEGDVP
jgi:KaiC/GvpD/RAD55 family RecA-like ATPase